MDILETYMYRSAGEGEIGDLASYLVEAGGSRGIVLEWLLRVLKLA
jgi:hypothetical protein